MKEFWNERYRNSIYAYGEEPNEFLKEQLQNLPAGEILFPADGEGRNGVYAASLGWNVTSFDISEEGKLKAMQLAKKNKVTLNYMVGELDQLPLEPNQFDVIALIYAHFPAGIKSDLHLHLIRLLRKGGLIIFEAFSKNQIEFQAKNEKAGGPKDVKMLFSKDEIRNDFAGFEIIQLEECKIALNEGLYHNGTGSVIRFSGIKL